MEDEIVDLCSSDDEATPTPVIPKLVSSKPTTPQAKPAGLRITSMFADDSDDEVAPVKPSSSKPLLAKAALESFSLSDEESDEEVRAALRSMSKPSTRPDFEKTAERLKHMSALAKLDEIGDGTTPRVPKRGANEVQLDGDDSDGNGVAECFLDDDEGDFIQSSLYNGEAGEGPPPSSSDSRRMLELMRLNSLSSDATTELPTPTEMSVLLLKHQRQALAWMVRREQEQDSPNTPRGGILADDQGFGKTVSMIALLLQNQPERRPNGVQPAWGTLIVTPTSIMQQWAAELEGMIDEQYRPRVLIYHGTNKVKDPYVLVKYDVVITSYATMVQEYPKVIARDEKRKPIQRRKKGPLFKLRWFRVVLDEAQAIKNFRAETFHACVELKAERRWCLTGTPLQNTIDDIYSLYIFLRYFVVDGYAHWKRLYKRPLEGKCGANRRAALFKRFQAELGVVLLRRAKTDKIGGKPVISLPAKHTSVLELNFSQTERAYYSAQETRAVRDMQRFGIDQGVTFALVILLRLRQSCGHPALCDWEGERQFKFSDDELDVVMERMRTRCLYKLLPEDVQNRLRIELGPGSEVAQSCPVCLDVIGESDGMVTKCGHIFCTSDFESWQKENDTCPTCRTPVGGDGDKMTLADVRKEIHALDRAKKREADKADQNKEECKEEPKLGSRGIVIQIGGKRDGGKRNGESPPKRPRASREEPSLPLKDDGEASGDDSDADSDVTNDDNEDGSKVKATATSTKIKAFMVEYKKIFETTEDKVLCFSQWTRMLDLVEVRLEEEGYEYVRLDGTMSPDERSEAIRLFNRRSKCRLFLISLQAGSTGLNLTAANRVFLLDSWWNPAVEDQAIDRVHRIGQTKEVHVVRLKIVNTVEDKILELQARKRELIDGALGVEGLKTMGRRRLTMQDVLGLFQGVAENVAARSNDEEAAGMALNLLDMARHGVM